VKNPIYKKYGIYNIEGKKLKNSKQILTDKNRFWGSITESVLDRIPNNIYGILLHKIYINGEIHWIVRESEKSKVCTLETAKFWVSKELREGPPRKGNYVGRH
jgi:hypothetical protein